MSDAVILDTIIHDHPLIMDRETAVQAVLDAARAIGVRAVDRARWAWRARRAKRCSEMFGVGSIRVLRPLDRRVAKAALPLARRGEFDRVAPADAALVIAVRNHEWADGQPWLAVDWRDADQITPEDIVAIFRLAE